MMGIKCQVRTETDSEKRESENEEGRICSVGSGVCQKCGMGLDIFNVPLCRQEWCRLSSYPGISDPEEPYP